MNGEISVSETLNIPVSKFVLHELVTLYWNEQEYPTRITSRFYNIDEEV